ncbi:MAG TPA: dienelactone hydrolase family protein [Kiloniellales bacterium]|jgi:carboxymethylenebutenolidase
MPEITISGPDGKFSGYLALPKKTPAPGIVVAQEIFGVNQVMRDVCDWLAEAGYLACCPDIFWRIEPGIQITDKTKAEWDRAFELFMAFDADKGIDDLRATLAHVRGHKACTGTVGAIGFCLGGKLAYLMAARTDADCSVGYYGVGLDELLGEAKSVNKPLLLHIAGKDQFVPKPAQEKIIAALSGRAGITLHSYPAQDHAFARIGGEHFDKAAAETANRRTLDFFKEHLRP